MGRYEKGREVRAWRISLFALAHNRMLSNKGWHIELENRMLWLFAWGRGLTDLADFSDQPRTETASKNSRIDLKICLGLRF